MKKFGTKQALAPILVLGLGTLLAGCTTLTDEAPEPTVSAPVTTPPAPTIEAAPEWKSTQFVDITTGAAVLKPLAGHQAVLETMGSGDASSATDSMPQGETFVMWTCSGTGPISIGTSDGARTDAECSDSDVGQIHMSSFVNHDEGEFEVEVTADPRARWHVLVTQEEAKG
ncbi:hypothetical protein [Paeniglutamicibacter sp. Y32M11]|uniref:hypothetical protein n=1 Tax=Paeniglutamicibacter sp. Y32M11 TaxID=2853258 RepID=UPI001C5314F0|nr:hypothetical protein [Paeniglutamicibacter sp. Y32M11]QXQ09551.1 hypothetical protein KUF55_13910 [Paeniglutamicibacter sp. Y32M11]